MVRKIGILMRACAGCCVLACATVAVVSAAAPAPAEKINAVMPLPAKAPAWVPGYRVRWPLHVLGDPAKQPAKSVITSLPTGGWLRPDAGDVVVQTAAGE